MKLEEQVVSLPLAKRLKELGVKQDSAFYWSGEGLTQLTAMRTFWPNAHPDENHYISAFTVAELGEILSKVKSGIFGCYEENYGYCIWLNFQDIDYSDPIVTDKKEADAIAKTLIYLIENNLIKGK